VILSHKTCSYFKYQVIEKQEPSNQISSQKQSSKTVKALLKNLVMLILETKNQKNNTNVPINVSFNYLLVRSFHPLPTVFRIAFLTFQSNLKLSITPS